MGLSNDVFGSYSAAFGSSNLAYQNCTFALGHGTEANGRCSVVMGFNTEADSDTDFVCGRYNVGGGTADSFVSTDPLFEVGNGTSSVHANAFTIYKNGTAAFAGYVNIAPGSNIPMFTGN
jgi:hypothetical protein